MLHINKVTETDLENILTLWNNGSVMQYVGFPNGLNKTLSDIQKWFEKNKNNPLAQYYTIYDDELGYCGETGYRWHESLCHMDIKLLPHAQGQGIGKKALTFSIQQAFENKATEVYVSPWDSNKKAIHFYSALGFTEIKRERAESNPNPLFKVPGSSVIYMKLTQKDYRKITP